MNIKKIILSTTAGVIMLASSIIPAFADSIAVNFEYPPYVTGNINGQDGWIKSGPYDVEVETNTYSIPSFVGQTLRISNAVTSGAFGDQTFSKPLVNEAGETSAENGSMSGGTRQPHFEAQFDLATALPALQAGLSMSVSPDRGDGARMSYLRFEDRADGVHVFFDDYQDGAVETAGTCVDGDNFVEKDIATLTRQPHTIKFVMDFVDGAGNDVVKIYIDGALVHTGTSWEDYFRYCEGNQTRTVDSLLFRVGGVAVLANLGNGFLVDNLSLSSGATPPVLVGPPTNKDQCKKDGWKTFNNPTFKNQGQCVSYSNHN